MSIRVIFQWKWVGLHLFTIFVCVGMVLLGRWQWHVGASHRGDLRNYGYALQWWTFTGFAVLMWWRLIRDAELRRAAGGAGTGDSAPLEAELHRPTAYVGYRPPDAPQIDDDPERLAYNEYLAQLNDQQEDAT